MNFSNCKLYGLKSKKCFKYLFGIQDNKFLRQDYIASLIEPYVDKSKKSRLIEKPSNNLKIIQKKIKNYLHAIKVPDNIFSGIKGRSYTDNASFHQGRDLRNMFKIDLKSFFPSIKRETVYKFFHEDLCCSADIAESLTNFTTIDLSLSSSKNIEDVYRFLNVKNIKSYNHLITGSPASPILSYLVNYKMFDEMQKVAIENNAIMTVYVDDVVFSSQNRLSKKFKEKILNIIKKYGYQISKNKVKYCTKRYPKLITGVIIDKNGKMTLQNSLSKKIIEEFRHLKKHPEDSKSRSRLKGLLNAARQIDKTAYPSIYKFAYDKGEN